MLFRSQVRRFVERSVSSIASVGRESLERDPSPRFRLLLKLTRWRIIHLHLIKLGFPEKNTVVGDSAGGNLALTLTRYLHSIEQGGTTEASQGPNRARPPLAMVGPERTVQ